ncbi:MAG: phasin family protein [Sphingomonas sp.]|uniref:phasin family protein n=1 Tax=Sphingomonas sp. TaxID=28214 RepID=UPI0018227DCA|nr:phasin family protein [Sphingomonas sp.]MBA3666362.1 phasin family protein [Sphingomonas sp.]
MADDKKTQSSVNAAVDAVAAPAKAAIEATQAAAAKPASTNRAAVTKPLAKVKKVVRTRRARKAPAKIVAAVKNNNKRAVKTVRATRKAAIAATVAPIERINTMAYDFNSLFAGFQLPGNEKFQNLFAGAGERSQQLVAKSQKTAEEMTDLAKANVDAIVEAGRIAANGAKAIGQDALASSKQGLERASDAVKTLAEAKSPTEFFQIQSELARASFDRIVAESSKLTERVVKLAGEAVQPLQNRASINAERVNKLVA